MSAFKGLYKKEIKISNALFLTGLIIITLVMMISLGLKEYFGEPMIPVVFLLLIIILHVFYLPVLLFSSLKIEGQSQLWLHNPNSGSSLFLSKLAAGLTYYIVSLLVSILLAKLSFAGLSLSKKYEGPYELVEGNLFIVGGWVTLISIYISVWLLFYWTLFHSLKRVPVLNKFRWLVILAAWILITTIGEFIGNIPAIEVLKGKGTMNLTFFNAEMPNMNIASIIMYVLVTIGVFLVSVWLLERKVEV